MDQYLGEIRLCAFQFAPKGWAFCNGALLPIMQNQALFALFGTQFGGDGKITFGLPDLRGRAAIHRNLPATQVGSTGGVETVSITDATMPAHTHNFVVSSAPATASNVGTTADHLLAQSNLYNAADPSVHGMGRSIYGTATAATLTPMANATCDVTGTGAAHENMQPSLVGNYIVALTGTFPMRS